MKKSEHIENYIQTISMYNSDNIYTKKLAATVFKNKLLSSFNYSPKDGEKLCVFTNFKSVEEAMRDISKKLWGITKSDFFEDRISCFIQFRAAENDNASALKQTIIMTIINWEKEMFLEISDDYIMLLTTEQFYGEKEFMKIVGIVKNTVFSKETPEKMSTINVVVYEKYGLDLQEAHIKTTNIDLNENYNDDFKDINDRMVQFIKSRDSGIAILRGAPGTGKTSYIRHLINNNAKSYIIITNSVAEHLAEPDYTSFLLQNKDSVFILEDCERILQNRTSTGYSSGIENILNMADGLMSDVFNIKFICTFNADMNTIDPALVRPGRCHVNYEFKPLCKEKSRNLLKKLYSVEDAKLGEINEMTLAEIYNYEDLDINKKMDIKSVSPKKKIGF